MAQHASGPIFTYHRKRIDFGEVIDPLVRLQIETAKGWERVMFLVDTGADTTVIPIYLATYFNISFDRSKSITVSGIGMSSTSAYQGRIRLKFGRRIISVRCYFVDSSLSTMILGRLDVFDHFTVVFDNEREEVRFIHIDKNI